MRERTFGKLKVRMVGGSDREGGGDGPLVVLMHGFGAPGDDLVGLHRVIAGPPGTRFLFPEAPLSLGPEFAGGRAWWPIDMMRLQVAMMSGDLSSMTHRKPEGLTEAHAAVRGLLDEVGSESLPAPAGGKLYLGGFSQGAMLALDVALRDQDSLAGVVLLSGTLIDADEWVPLMAKRKGLRVFQSHGQEDPILPYVIADELRGQLTRAGCDVSFVSFRGGHGVPPSVTDGLSSFLRA